MASARLLLPRFFELLYEAHDAAEAVQDFDLDSNNEASVEKWAELRKTQRQTCQELIAYCSGDGLALLDQLEGL